MSRDPEYAAQSDYVCPRCGNDEEFEYFGFCKKYIQFVNGVRVVDGEFLLEDDTFYHWDDAIRCVQCGADTRETNYMLEDFIPILRRERAG